MTLHGHDAFWLYAAHMQRWRSSWLGTDNDAIHHRCCIHLFLPLSPSAPDLQMHGQGVLAMVTIYLDWWTDHNQCWRYCREFKTVQRVSFSISDNAIPSRQLFSYCTGCQTRLTCSSSCVRSYTHCLAYFLMRCSRSILQRHENYDRLLSLCNSETAVQVWRVCILTCWLTLLLGHYPPAQMQAQFKKLLQRFFIYRVFTTVTELCNVCQSSLL